MVDSLLDFYKSISGFDLIYLIIDQRYYKKDSSIRYLIFELIEFYLRYNLNSKFSENSSTKISSFLTISSNLVNPSLSIR